MKLPLPVQLKHKLKLVIILTTGIAMVLACSVLLLYEALTFRESLHKELSTTAEILGRASAPAILFNDAATATEILVSLRADPQITGAAIYDSAGRAFASYRRDEESPALPPSMPPAGFERVHGYLTLSEPIIEERGGEEVGSFVLQADFRRMQERMRLYAGVLGATFAGVLGISFLLSVYFQRLVLRPIQTLAETARIVSRKKDYSVRAVAESADELGVLVETFNQMLDEISHQDAALREAKSDLEQRVRVRTEELEQRTLDLERSNADLGQFAYIASHDLMEPLRMVSSFTQLLKQRYRDKLDADANEFIDFAVSGAQRMQELLNALLEYSRVGTSSSRLVPVEVSKVLDDTLDNLRNAIEESGAQVTRDALPRLVADPVQFVQLFQNLIGNAIKFRGESAPRIHVSARRSGAEWIFEVRDNGIGMAPGDFDRIFVIFHRLDREGKYSGAGIGLAVCKRIVERHGGRIWVESRPGKGSQFFFAIPERLNQDEPNAESNSD